MAQFPTPTLNDAMIDTLRKTYPSPDQMANAVANQMMAKMSSQQDKQKAELGHALDAFGYVTMDRFFNDGTVKSMKDMIRAKIEAHQKMIKSLEWFDAHLKLDEPENTLVGEIIWRGLNDMLRQQGKDPIR